jgi:hypothetical protein
VKILYRGLLNARLEKPLGAFFPENGGFGLARRKGGGRAEEPRVFSFSPAKTGHRRGFLKILFERKKSEAVSSRKTSPGRVVCLAGPREL